MRISEYKDSVRALSFFSRECISRRNYNELLWYRHDVFVTLLKTAVESEDLIQLDLVRLRGQN